MIRKARTAGDFPSCWVLALYEIGFDLEVTPLQLDQELDMSSSCWEGTVASGRRNGGKEGIWVGIWGPGGGGGSGRLLDRLLGNWGSQCVQEEPGPLQQVLGGKGSPISWTAPT